MNDEERQRLCKDLRGMVADEEEYVSQRCAMAAHEIERLAKLVDRMSLFLDREIAERFKREDEAND